MDQPLLRHLLLGPPAEAPATWDFGCIDCPRLRQRFTSYAKKAGVGSELIGEKLSPCMHVQIFEQEGVLSTKDTGLMQVR